MESVVGNGRKNRYAYCAVFDESISSSSVDLNKNIGLVKIDLSMEPSGSTLSRELRPNGNTVGVFHYGAGRVGGDSIFVPRNPEHPDADEDDGYLISYVYDVNTG